MQYTPIKNKRRIPMLKHPNNNAAAGLIFAAP
jgi:hypothetical protein